MRALLRPARGRIRPDRARRRVGQAPDPGRPADHLALRGLPAVRGPAYARAARGADSAAEGAAAGRGARAGGGVGQERHRQPDALVQGPRRRGGRGQGAGARLRGGGLPVHGQPRQRRGRALSGRRARLVRLHPGRPRGAEGARHRGLRHPPRGRARHLRRRQPALHRALRRPRLGVRERERAALLRGGLEDDRVRDRGAARLRAARPRGRADRVGLAVHEDRARIRGVARGGARDGRAAGVQRRPGGGLLAGRAGVRGGAGLLPPGQAGHDRQVTRDREPGRRALRARPGAALGWLDRLRDRRRGPRGHQAARPDDGHLHGDRRRGHHRDARGSSPSAATSGPTSGWWR